MRLPFYGDYNRYERRHVKLTVKTFHNHVSSIIHKFPVRRDSCIIQLKSICFNYFNNWRIYVILVCGYYRWSTYRLYEYRRLNTKCILQLFGAEGKGKHFFLIGFINYTLLLLLKI